MKFKYKIITALVVIILSAVFCFAVSHKEKPDISGQWLREDNVVIEFFSEGVWEGEEVFEGIGGEWRIYKDKIIMEDLLGNTFEASLNKDEKGEYIFLNGEAYYRRDFAK